MCNHFYKENVFLSGLIFNIISSIIIVTLIILFGIQYKYININFAKINIYQNLKDFQMSFCIIYIFCCILGFIVFIKQLECKTMQKIYIIYAILACIYSIIVCVIGFLSSPNIIKNNYDLNCESMTLKGILKDFNKIDHILYDININLCSDECPCINDNMNFQKCPDLIKNNIFNYYNKNFAKNFNNNKFMSYWSKLENKFKCIGFCNISNFVEGNITYKFLFTDNENIDIKNYGCLFPLSRWLNNMILAFSSLVIINIILSVVCIYICIAILYDKVYEGPNLPQFSSSAHRNKILFKSENKQIGIINGNSSKKKSIDVKITNDK